MIELTEQQIADMDRTSEQPLQLVNPRTNERFVLFRTEEYDRLKEAYDDSPRTRDELQAVAWERIERSGESFDEYDSLPEKA